MVGATGIKPPMVATAMARAMGGVMSYDGPVLFGLCADKGLDVEAFALYSPAVPGSASRAKTLAFSESGPRLPMMPCSLELRPPPRTRSSPAIMPA